MLTCSRVLAQALRKIRNKQSQMNYIVTALGSNRVVRAWRDANSSAKNPASTGVEILNLSMNGAMSTSSGAITGLGTIFQKNIFLAGIDLATGSSVMRIEGNGHFVQGTLGLNGDFDFSLPVNPDPIKGLAFDSGSTMAAPTFTPSGTGRVAPVKIATSPHVIKLWDWSDVNSPRLAGQTAFVNRLEDYVLEDAEMAAEIGDASLYQTNDIFWEQFSLGATLMISSPENTEVGNVPLYEICVNYKIEGAWLTYPQNNTMFEEAAFGTPPAHKVTVEDELGNVLYTWEMHGGEAINDPRLNSGNFHRGGRTNTAPLQPPFNAAMALYWRNVLPRKTDVIDRIYPGARNYRPSMSKCYYSFLSVEPLLTGGYDGGSANGLADFWIATKWPNQGGTPYPIDDPYASIGPNTEYSALYNAWAEGYGYEPGAYGTHNWYTSPGGPRHDRSPINSVLVMYLTYPDGFRAQRGTPWREYIDEFNKNYFNHSNHWVSSASGMTTIPWEEWMNDEWTADGTYYGNYPRSKAVMMSGNQRGGTSPNLYDAEGNMRWSGWGRDPLHDYANRAWGALAFRSPMFALTSKFDLMTAMFLHNNPFWPARNEYLQRTMAWQWVQLVLSWKVASKHPLAVPKKAIEDRLAKMIDTMYASIHKPAHIDMVDDAFCRGIRNLGLSLDGGNGDNWGEGAGRLGFYTGHMLQLMKQTGLWHVMCKRGTIYETTLKGIIKDMDTFCFGNIVDANGLGGVYFRTGTDKGRGATGLDRIADNWAEWYQYEVSADDKYTDFVTEVVYSGSTVQRNTDGTPKIKLKANKDVSFNTFEQYARLRKDWFPEIPHPKMDAAIAKLDVWEAFVKNAVDNHMPVGNKWAVDYMYRYPGVSPFLGPKNPGDLKTSY